MAIARLLMAIARLLMAIACLNMAITRLLMAIACLNMAIACLLMAIAIKLQLVIFYATKRSAECGLKVLYKLFGKGQKCLYFCQDETRLGLQTIPGKMLTLKGVKPLGCVQWKRENFYLYGAVEIRSGDSYFYEFSHLDSQCFQLFVNQLSENFPDTVNFLQLDNASFHKNIDFPENIIPIFQPPYSPELNPIERFWEHFKRELRWENCKNLKELQLHVSDILLKIDQATLSSLTGWDYLIDAILGATS